MTLRTTMGPIRWRVCAAALTIAAFAACGGSAGDATPGGGSEKAAASARPLHERVDRARARSSRLRRAAEIWDAKCAACHGPAGGGGIGPNLTDRYWLHGGSVKEIHRSIARGFPLKGMIAYEEDLEQEELDALVAYVLELQGTDPPNAVAPQGEPAD
jgi:cytochrome c oxidase cbb3-type subunit 3